MNTYRIIRILLAMVLWAGNDAALRAADTNSGPGGHWEGDIQLPGTGLGVRVDLADTGAGVWSGTIDIPMQGLRGFKLGGVTVSGQAVSFDMPGIPGEPRFAGELDQAAKSLSGTFTQGGQTHPFKLERKAKAGAGRETPARGVPGKGLAGSWQGSLKPSPISELRLGLELANSAAGALEGAIISIDQGGARVPITALEEKEGTVHLETKSVGGVFDGKINGDGSELGGDWRQGGNTLPLVFKRLGKTSKPAGP